MRKALFVISSLLVLSTTALAQETFYPDWNLGIKAGATYTAGEAKFADLLSYPTIALSAGYQFTPVFSLRGELSGFQGKGSLPAIGKIYKWNYGQLNADAILDICNIFADYKSTRLFNPYIFAGIGGNLAFNNKEAQAVKADFPSKNKLWDGSLLSFTGRFGGGIDIRLSDAVKLSLEVVDNVLTDKFNSKTGEAWQIGKTTLDFDYNISALLGLKFTLGQARKKAEAAAALAAAEAAAAKAAADKAAADKAAAERAAREAAERAAAEKAAAERAAAEKAAAEAAARAAARAAEEHVLFIIGRTDIRPSETPKIDHIIEIMNKYPEAVCTVTGYADKNTGTAKGNLALSKKRAEIVTDALIKAGIAPERIVTAYKGDTEAVSPVIAENRVAVLVTK